MTKKKQESFLLVKHFDKGAVKSDGDNEAAPYKSMIAQDSGKTVIRNVIIFTSRQLAMTLIEWLSRHGYRKSTNLVNGKQMNFFRSNNSSIRFFTDEGKLSNGADFNSSTFILEY